MPQNEIKDIFTNQMGQILFPGQPTVIKEKTISPGTDITMRNTRPQIALTPYGASMMQPDMNYSFAGNTVVELPMAQMGRQQQANSQQQQMLQVIQMYAQIKGVDPNQLVQELQSLPQEEQQKSLELMVGEVQQAMAQQQQQATMAQSQGAAPQEEAPMAKDGGCIDCMEAFPQANTYPTSWADYSGNQYAEGGEAYPQAMNMNWFYEDALNRYMATGGSMLPQAQTNTTDRYDQNPYNKNQKEARYQKNKQALQSSPAIQALQKFEHNVNRELGNPAGRAARFAQGQGDIEDRLRHANAAAFTNQAIQNSFPDMLKYTGLPQIAGFLGSNAMGFGHELSNWDNETSFQDLYNNLIGSGAGTFNNPEYASKLIYDLARNGVLMPGEVAPPPNRRNTVLLPGNRKQGGEAFPQAQTYLPYDRPGETRPNFMFQMGGQDEFGGQPDLETIYRKMKSGGLAVDAKKKRGESLDSNQFTQYLSKGGLKHYQGPDQSTVVSRPEGTFLNYNTTISPERFLNMLKENKVYTKPGEPDLVIPSDPIEQGKLAQSYYDKWGWSEGNDRENQNIIDIAGAFAEIDRAAERAAAEREAAANRLPGEADDEYFMRTNNQIPGPTGFDTGTSANTSAATTNTGTAGTTSTTTGTTPIVQQSPYATNIDFSNNTSQNKVIDTGGGRSYGAATPKTSTAQSNTKNPQVYSGLTPNQYFGALAMNANRNSDKSNILTAIGAVADIGHAFSTPNNTSGANSNVANAAKKYLANKENKWDYQPPSPPTYPALERNQESEGVGAATGAKKGGKIKRLHKYQGIAGSDMTNNSSTVGDMSGGMNITNPNQYGTYGAYTGINQEEPVTTNQAFGQQQTTNIQDPNLETASQAYQDTAEMGQPKMQRREANEMNRMARKQARYDLKNFKQTDEYKQARKQDRKDFWKDPNARFDHAKAARIVGATDVLANEFRKANEEMAMDEMKKMGLNTSATLGVQQGSDRGDFMANTGKFRPNDDVEAQDPGRGMADKTSFYNTFNQSYNARLGGRILDMFEDGGVYDLDEDTIRLIMEAGGSVEFI
jgi:hypothetical protein